MSNRSTALETLLLLTLGVVAPSQSTSAQSRASELLEPPVFERFVSKTTRSPAEYCGRAVLYAFVGGDDEFDDPRFKDLQSLHKQYCSKGLSIVVVYMGSTAQLDARLLKWPFEFAYAVESVSHYKYPLRFRFGMVPGSGFLLVSPVGVVKAMCLWYEFEELEPSIREMVTSALKEPLSSSNEPALKTLCNLLGRNELGRALEFANKELQASSSTTVIREWLSNACKASLAYARRIGRSGDWLEARDRLTRFKASLLGSPEHKEVITDLTNIEKDPAIQREITAQSKLRGIVESMEEMTRGEYRKLLRDLAKEFDGCAAARRALEIVDSKPATPP